MVGAMLGEGTPCVGGSFIWASFILYWGPLNTGLTTYATWVYTCHMAHGTKYQYERKGCRCPECRAWNAAKSRRWREKHPDAHKDWLAKNPGYHREWLAKHPGYYRKRREENPERVREYDAKKYPKVMAARRRLWRDLELWKATQGCCWCGRKDGALVHHHIDPATKIYDVGIMACYSLERVLDEIDKCVVLCAGCHVNYHVMLREEL